MSAVTGSGEVHRGCKFSMTNLMLTERLGDSGTIEDDTRTWSPVILVPDESGTFLSAICSGRGPDSSWPPIGASGVVLEMGGNGMEKFPDVPDAVKAKVLRLTASGGLIAGLSAELDGYKQLRALDFSGNRIRNISDRAFSGAQHILKLDLSGNEIGSVGKWASHPSLLHLNLAGNEISALLPESLEGLKNLAYLDLSNNLLTKLPDNFGSALTKLKHLHVAGNKFVSVPRLTRSLFLLNLSSNYLESLVLPQIDDLFVLDISRNNLHDLDNVYEQLSLKVKILFKITLFFTFNYSITNNRLNVV